MCPVLELKLCCCVVQEQRRIWQTDQAEVRRVIRTLTQDNRIKMGLVKQPKPTPDQPKLNKQKKVPHKLHLEILFKIEVTLNISMGNIF